jgi:glucose/arabinose dehydrogenase
VSAKGGVEAYTGFDGRRFAVHRSIVALPDGVGEMNVLALAPDGRVWLGVSAPCDHCSTSVQDAAAVLSFEPDGSDLRVEASRIRAPVGLAFVPETSDLLITMNQRDDLGDATPGDWLALVASGQDWGFPNCYGQGGSACAGVPSPVAVLDAHAALSGVAIVTGQLGEASATSAIVAEWSLGKVQRVTLTRNGSTYTGVVTPFLTGVENPVAVAVRPDGALFVGDWSTGTIYRITVALA